MRSPRNPVLPRASEVGHNATIGILLPLPVRHPSYPYDTPGACSLREEHRANEVGYVSAASF